jgi:Tol biopolymer transport system component
MKGLILAALSAAVLMSGCGSGVTAGPATGVQLHTAQFPNQIPSTCPLPDATAGTAYSVSITATGGVQPYRWALALDTSLPPGLTLTSGTPAATISGTPQEGGNYTFTLQATDAEAPPVTATNDFSLTVIAPNPVPAISSLSPSSATAGGAAFTLTVDGSSFVSGATVDWNGSARTTTFVSATQLTAAITASDIAAAGTANVTVVNPSPGGGTSNAVTFTIIAATAAGFPKIVSVSTAGIQGNGDSAETSISGAGRFVAFGSFADNLVAGDTNGHYDVFLRDTCQTASGPVSGCTPSTIRVSVATDGTQANSSSFSPSISADGRYVAFDSNATNLVAGDTNNASDIFVRDTCVGAPSGCTPSTTRVSVATDGTQGNGDSSQPSISADGRFVAFASGAGNLIPGGTAVGPLVFLRDTCAGAASGCTPSTTLVSVATDGTQANSSSEQPAISADGRYVAFGSAATNLVANDTNQGFDVFVRDTCQSSSGPVSGCTPSTIRVSVASDGTQGDADSSSPSISADGRYVAFGSAATNLVANDTNQSFDVFVRDTCAGVPVGTASLCTPSTIRASVATDGTQASSSTVGSVQPSISADGRFVAFDSLADNLVAGDTNGSVDVFVRDTCGSSGGPVAGCTPSTIRVSVASDGTQGNSHSGDAVTGLGAALGTSADGHFVTFASYASNLVANDTNGAEDVFLTTNSILPPPGPTLWVPNGPSVTAYPATSLAVGGDVPPSVDISGSSTGLAGTQCAAFDPAGNLWITDFGSKLISEFPASSLSSGGNVAPAVTFSSTTTPDPVGCVFDSSGNLWVASFTCCVAGDPGVAVGRFSPAQLAAGGSLTPTAAIEGNLTQLDSPKGVTIDSSGNLWVANNANVVCCSTVVEYGASDIAGSGALNIAPITVIGGDLTGLNVTGAASGVTFDQAGNLWVASDARPVPSVLEYSASDLAAGGALNIAPAVTISGSAQMTGAPGLVFDSAGNLWVTNDVAASLLEFDPAALSQGGSVAPTLVVSGPNSKLVGPFMPTFH